MEKFDKNICEANMAGCQLKALGETIGLLGDDLPHSAASDLGDLIQKLAGEMLRSIAAIEEIQLAANNG